MEYRKTLRRAGVIAGVGLGVALLGSAAYASGSGPSSAYPPGPTVAYPPGPSAIGADI